LGACFVTVAGGKQEVLVCVTPDTKHAPISVFKASSASGKVSFSPVKLNPEDKDAGMRGLSALAQKAAGMELVKEVHAVDQESYLQKRRRHAEPDWEDLQGKRKGGSTKDKE